MDCPECGGWIDFRRHGFWLGLEFFDWLCECGWQSDPE